MICGSFFSGIGLLDYGLCLAGFEHAWGCEQDEWRRRLWEQRFRVPCHADVRDANAGWGRVDLVAGGFPCKGVSTIGPQTGFGHPETVLWREMARAIRELRPRYVLVENVAHLLSLHDGALCGEVLGDLAAGGFDLVWDCLPAAAVGAPHLRDRAFIIASHPDEPRADAHAAAGAPRPAACERARVAPDAAGVRHERPGGPRDGRPGSSDGDLAAADPQSRPPRRGSEDAAGGLAAVADGVDWGKYEPAIRRWEAVHGPAPEPLIAGVDARSAARVVRSRLSALGDGVQVQVGYLAGLHIRALEDERMRSAA